MEGRMFSNVGGGMLGLDMQLHPQTQTTQNPPQNPQPQHPQLQKQHPQMMAFTLQQQQQQQEQQTQLSMQQPSYQFGTQNQNQNPHQKNKNQMTQLTNSDEDEPGCMNDDGNFDGKRKNSANSPWHRMKWTDGMVRLLIMAVYYIGDEAGSELGSDKKKLGNGGGGGGGGGLLQKKGKWKSVSKAMMEKGFKVSPQQCEDKFNDLNKRYKRVNDILGKGTACKVVENQSLLETMDLAPKMKEEAKKLLNSKHLFFREMCAYHNSCGHGTVGPTSEAGTVDVSHQRHQNQPHQQQRQQAQQQQLCAQHPTSSTSPISLSSMVPRPDDHNEDDDDDNDNDDDTDDFDDEDDDHEERRASKRARTSGGISSNTLQAASQRLNGEAMGVIQDGNKSFWEKKKWVMTQLVQLEEQGMKFQGQALELEKQRLKWLKFSNKKEREMEKMKIDNEKNRIENERLMLLLKQKEIELMVVEQQQQQIQQQQQQQQQQQLRGSNPSCVTG